MIGMDTFEIREKRVQIRYPFVVDVIFVHESPFESEQTRYNKITKNQNVRSACVHQLLVFVASLKIGYLVSKKKENM